MTVRFSPAEEPCRRVLARIVDRLVLEPDDGRRRVVAHLRASLGPAEQELASRVLLAKFQSQSSRDRRLHAGAALVEWSPGGAAAVAGGAVRAPTPALRELAVEALELGAAAATQVQRENLALRVRIWRAYADDPEVADRCGELLARLGMDGSPVDMGGRDQPEWIGG